MVMGCVTNWKLQVAQMTQRAITPKVPLTTTVLALSQAMLAMMAMP
jgi:hypothetical protein